MPGAYREWRPRPELGELVACVWERTTGPDGPTTTRVLPDGCVDIVSTSDGRRFIAGPDTGPVMHELAAGTIATGLRFRIGAAAAALGVPAAELRDQRIPLDALWGRGAQELGERLAEADGTAGRLVALQDMVVGRSSTGTPDALVLEASQRLGRPGARVAAIGRELGLSERELRRRFQRTVGYGPKLLDRVLRFHRFLGRAERALRPHPAAPAPGHGPAAIDLAASAFELGYADQAHLSRACRELSGLSPTQLLATRLG
jgi:AraC-like DNA-binding protein